MSPGGPRRYGFGPFVLEPDERRLLHDGEPLDLTPKALDVLTVLVERHGHLVTKGELLEAVWPDAVVEENALSVNISRLRAVLGEAAGEGRYIETVPRSGYRFVSDVELALGVAEEETTVFKRMRARVLIETRWLGGAAILGLLTLVGLGVLLAGGREVDGVGGDAGERRTAAFAPEAEQTALAVLPFVTVGVDSAEYFADGLTDELIATLATSPSLRVAARTSAFTFKGADVPADSIGRALNVAYLVEGTVRTFGDRVRIAAQLVDAATGFHEWSETYDRNVADALSVQQDIAQAVAFKLQTQTATFRKNQTDDPVAYALAQKGRHVYDGGGDFEVVATEAARLFGESAARDPSYAYAWAGVANARRILAGSLMVDDVEEEWAAARAAAERAIELDPSEGFAHYALGWITLWHDRDPEGALEHYERAVAANPSDARALARMAKAALISGREAEAVQMAGRAVLLDPLSSYALGAASYVFAASGQHGRGVELARRAHALNPENATHIQELANVLAVAGLAEEAIEVAKRGIARNPALAVHFRNDLAYAYAQLGDRASAERTLAGIPRNPHYMRAVVEAALGQPDSAFSALARSVADDEPYLMELTSDPWFDPLHADPRWKGVIAEVREQVLGGTE